METNNNTQYDFLFNDKYDVNSVKKVEGKIIKTKTKKQSRLIARQDELNDIFPETIDKDESVHLISSDNFGSIELLEVLNSRFNFNHISITTWSYNTHFVEVIEKYLKKGISIDFFVDKSMKTRKASLYAQMVLMLDSYPNFKIKIHHMIHSKVTVLVSDNEKLTIEASANYSNNQRIENFTITNNSDLANFHTDWMNEIIGG